MIKWTSLPFGSRHLVEDGKRKIGYARRRLYTNGWRWFSAMDIGYGTSGYASTAWGAMSALLRAVGR